MPLIPRHQIPNALTVLRLVFAAGFFAALELYRYPDQGVIWGNIAIVVFCLAVVTDALDGYFARKWEVVSVFGRVMDPFCDKVLVLGAYLYLAGPRFIAPEDPTLQVTGVEIWMVVVIFARELLVTGIRGVVEATGASFASRWSGKWKMILQSIGLPIVLGLTVNFAPHENDTVHWIIIAIVWATLLVTVWSGVPYVLDTPKALAGRADES